MGAEPTSIKAVLMHGDLRALLRIDDRVRPVVVPSGQEGVECPDALPDAPRQKQRRAGNVTRRLLRELAEHHEEATPTPFRRLLAEVQVVVLGATAAILQTASGLQPSPD
mmetsp:Transcript_26729/g.86553  ORF Transcript_26729/g.86553 Transcript_26729/m.86553 type:complete len:110 (-) Transcript_26729:749-1078(-)